MKESTRCSKFWTKTPRARITICHRHQATFRPAKLKPSHARPSPKQRRLRGATLFWSVAGHGVP